MSWKPRGVLNLHDGLKKFDVSRFLPSDPLKHIIEHYWHVQWKLKDDESFIQSNLPHPCVNIAIETGKAEIFGVVKKKFSYTLSGHGQVFGVRFKPGGFYPFLQSAVTEITGKTCSVSKILDLDSKTLENTVLDNDNGFQMAAVMESSLLSLNPTIDEKTLSTVEIVDQISKDRSIVKVDDLLPLISMSKRSLQELFRLHVGASPKWVIKIYRLQEVAERISDNPKKPWEDLAIDLGYFDQAHFIRDFKSVVGTTPTEYSMSLKNL